MRRLLTILASALLLQGCVAYVPPVWDAFDAIHATDQITEGETTRAEVLALLGQPTSEHEGYIAYVGSTSSGIWCIEDCRKGDETGWWINIGFDDDNVVSRIATSKDPNAKPFRRLKAEEDCNAMVRQAPDLEKADLVALNSKCRTVLDQMSYWTFSCFLAHNEYGPSQYYLGKGYHRGYAPAGPDLMKALQWYELSASNEFKKTSNSCYLDPQLGWTCDVATEDALKDIRSKLSQRSINEVEARLARWQPDPASCGEPPTAGEMAHVDPS